MSGRHVGGVGGDGVDESMSYFGWRDVGGLGLVGSGRFL